MIYRIFFFLTVLAVIVGSLMLARQQGGKPAPAAVQRSGSEGYSARNARLVETGPDGEPLYTLDAAAIRQDPDRQQVQLTDVLLRFRDSSGRTWTATAERGQLGQDSRVIKLSRDVQLWGTPPGTQGPAEIATEKLSYDTRTEVAETGEPVTFVWPGCRFHAIGLVANLKEHRVQLESSVHGICAQ